MTGSVPDKRRLTDDLVSMIATPSINPFGKEPKPGHREQEYGALLVQKMQALGLEVGSWDVAPGRPNVWGRLKGAGDGPAIMLAGHLDTVGVEGYDDGLTPQVAEGRVYGRGACDMKAAFACYLETIRLIQEAGLSLPGDLIIAATADEEDLLLGSRDWKNHGPRADYGIIGEPSGLQVCPAHKGQVCVFIRTEGVAVHSSGPERGVNAVEHMGAVLSHFSGLNREIQESGPSHPLCGTGRFSMNVIRGGTIASAIPGFCELEVDRRFLPGETIEGVLADYQLRLDSLSADMPDLRVSLSEPSLVIPSLDLPADNPLVEAMQRAVRQVTGADAPLSAFPGGTDAPNMGCPCVICGPGYLEQAHTRNEYVDISQMEQVCLIYLSTILDLNGVKM